MISLRFFLIRMFYLVSLIPPKDSPLQNTHIHICASSVVRLPLLTNQMCGSTCLGLPLLSWVFKSCSSCVVINKVWFAVVHVPHLPPKREGSLIHNAAARTMPLAAKHSQHFRVYTYIRTYVRTCVFYHSLIYSSYIALTSVCLVLSCTTSLSSTTYTHTYICSYMPYSMYVRMYICTHQSVLVSGASDSR